MQDRLKEIGERILRREEERHQLGKQIRESIGDYIYKWDGSIENGYIGAVDSGFEYNEYGHVIILLIRSVGAIFHYHNVSLHDVEYIPSPVPELEIIDNDYPLEREDIHPFKSLHRLRAELSRAMEVLEKGPDFFFLDGSIVPQIVDKPHPSAPKPLKNLYYHTISLFEELYRAYPHILIGGIVKDSRGNRFGNFLASEGIEVPPWSDISWLLHTLEPGEYTHPIPYSENPEKHATLKDLSHPEHIYMFYVRPSPYDRPYRVEFYSSSPEKDAQRLVNLLMPLSSSNPMYSIPPFMVEIDMRARLSKEALKYVRSYLERTLMGKYPHVRLFERRPFL